MSPTRLRPPSLVGVCALAFLTTAAPAAAQLAARPTPGILLEDLTWPQAENVLTPEAVVVAPLGAAAMDYHPQGTGGFTCDPKAKGTHSPTGIWGDAVLATREKGRRVVETMVEGMLKEIAALRAAAVPAGR